MAEPKQYNSLANTVRWAPEEPGQKLKRVRERLNLRFREVEEASTKIAQKHGNDEYVVALSRLADIENKGTIPSIYRLYSLCVIYRLDLTDVLSWYGISTSTVPADAGVIEHGRSHLIGFRPQDGEVQLPIALDLGLDLSKTSYLSRLIEQWGTLPLMLLNNIDLRNHRYGLIGTDDWSMFPIIPPGSLVVIDDTQRKIATSRWASEFDRPIYFLEHREGYACSWCSLNDGKLIVQPHPASGCDVESYVYPNDIEIIGLVTKVALSLYAGGRRER